MPYLRGSWYSQLPQYGWIDREDRSGSAAFAPFGKSIPDSQQGIALPTRGGLGKWYNVTPPGSDRPVPLQQTDIGPAPWTGRGVDISAAGAHQMGYSPKNFPTDASFKVEPIDLTGLGLAAGYRGGVPGDNTAIAEGPPERQPQGRKMPQSLMDMFQPQDATGQPTDFAGALRGNANAMVGLGMGLLQPRSLAVGAPAGNAWTNALEGYQAGSVADSRRGYQQAQLAHQKQQEIRQAAMDKFNMGMRQKEFDRGGITEAQRAMTDVLGANATPEQKADFMKNYYASKTDPGGWILKDIIDPRDPDGERKITVQEHNRTGQIRPPQLPGTGTATAGADPFTAGGGQPVYGVGGNYSTPAPATVAAPAPAAGGIPPAPPGADRKEWKKEQTKLQVQRQIAEEARKKNASMIDPVTEDIDRAIQQTKQYPGMIAGTFGNLMKNIPGSQAADVGKLVDTIKANASLDKLSQMRAQSPTGASGLGAVTQGEHKLLQDSIGALDQSQTPEQFLYNLDRVKRIRHEIIHGPGTAPPSQFELPESQRPKGSGKPAAPKPGFVDKEFNQVFKGGDPSKPENWAPVR